MKQMKRFTSLAALALILFGFVSCIYDDQDDCPRQNVKVIVRMNDYNTITRASYPFVTETVDLYVFEETQGRYTGGYQQTCQPGKDPEFLLQLEPGDYRFVIWTNHCEQYRPCHTREEYLANNTTYREMTLSFTVPQDGNVTEDIPDLVFGQREAQTITGYRTHIVEVNTIPYTNIINLTAKNLPAHADGYTMTITDDNCHYTFDNNYAPADPTVDRTFKYTRFLASDGNGSLKATTKVLRITDPDVYNEKTNPTLTLSRGSNNRSAGNTLYQADLVEIIKQAYAKGETELDFDKETQFDITLDFNTNMEAVVSVNGWNITQQIGDLE